MRFSLAILALCLAAACSSKPTGAPPAPKELPAADKGSQNVTKSADKTPEPMTPNQKIECSTKGDARILELRTKGKGCELAYTKNGQEGIVASAASGNQYCESTMTKIRDRLKGAGFDCK
jgi:hypothetical protein